MLGQVDRARMSLEAAINATAAACQSQVKEVAALAENSARELAGRLEQEAAARDGGDQQLLNGLADGNAAQEQL
eukprot:SAG22_NODE_16668_length_320_cov_0.936652_1_plen_73_part_01